MHRPSVTRNYAWLPHNLNQSIGTPTKYQGMPIQPLGDRHAFYEEMIRGCVKYYGDEGQKCLNFEKSRIEKALQQPKVSLRESESRVKSIVCLTCLVFLSRRVCTTSRRLATPRLRLPQTCFTLSKIFGNKTKKNNIQRSGK